MNDQTGAGKRDALILFVREPVLGEVKTRLAKTLGEETALKWYIRMLKRLKKTALSIDADRWVFFDRSPSGETREFWPEDQFEFEIQEGRDLGERMFHAFRYILESTGYDKALLCGSDCPGITKSILEEGFSVLNDRDTVLGPSTDGGYYLIGMKKAIRPVFYHIPWSTGIVLSLTEDRLQQEGFTRSLLPELTDVDTEEDLEQWEMEDGKWKMEN